MVITPRLRPEVDCEHHDGDVYYCSYTRDGAFVLSTGADGQVRLWEVETGHSVTTLDTGSEPLSCCVMSPDGSQWLTGSMEGQLSHWDAVSHEILRSEISHTRPISAIAYSPDGKWLVTTSWDQKVAIRSMANLREPYYLYGHGDLVDGCQFSPNGSTLLTWSHDGTLRLWSTEKHEQLKAFTDHQDGVTSAAFSPNGNAIVSASRNGTVLLQDRDTGKIQGQIRQKAEVCRCFFLPDGSWIVTLDREGRALLFHGQDLKPQKQLSTGFPVNCGAISPRGNQLVIGGPDGKVRFIILDGIEEQPLSVTPTITEREAVSGLKKFLGRPDTVKVYQWTCPSCSHSFEQEKLPSSAYACSQCHHPLSFILPASPIIVKA